jgi:hypothetical protein
VQAESALFGREQFSLVARNQNQNFPQKRQNQKFSSEKNAFFSTRKDVESYSQMPGKRN